MPRDDMAELAARIERLEQRLDDGVAATPAATPSVGQERFWLLDELRRRAGDSAMIYAGLADLPNGPVAWQVGHDPVALLDVDWVDLASRIAALGHPVRLRILQLVLRRTATTAAELSRTEGLGTTGQVYHHLRQLIAAGWLRTGSRGVHEVPAERVIPLLIILAAAG
ncbi:winged helix-turn-helix domain-containing protein [Microlunatus speluncae]|uniref:winged helix-turn-helix domain-containing protein n=1 Tax=Microlunatus speluncae TaxID=2594267 RepID=UPI001C2DC9CB|nr:helix-turn-helix domain-containing protein [Microlunatus speluncae]